VTLKFLSRVAVFLMWAMLVMALLTTCASKCDAQLETFPSNPFSPFGRADIQVSPMVGAAPGQTLRRTFVNVDSTNTCQEESHIVYCSGNSVVPSKSRDLVPGAASASVVSAKHSDATQQPSRRLFWAEVGVLTASSVADGVSTVRCIKAFPKGQESESSWLYGRRPTYPSYFVRASALEGVQAFFSYRFQHSPRHWLRVVGHSIMLIEAADHTKGTLHNSRLLSDSLRSSLFKVRIGPRRVGPPKDDSS